MSNATGETVPPFVTAVLQNRFNLVTWLAMLCNHPQVWAALGGAQASTLNKRLLRFAQDALSMTGASNEAARLAVRRVLRQCRKGRIADIYVGWTLTEMAHSSYVTPADDKNPLEPATQLVVVSEDDTAAWVRAVDRYFTNRLRVDTELLTSLSESANGVDVALAALGDRLMGDNAVKQRAATFWGAMLQPDMVAFMKQNAPGDITLWSQAVAGLLGNEAGNKVREIQEIDDADKIATYIMQVLQRVYASPRRDLLHYFGSHGVDLLRMITGR